jgi:phage FluMu gp28-like protein
MTIEPDELPTADQAPPPSPVDELFPGQLPPEGFDPLADGILMAHQKAWIEDQSTLKLAEKGRRTGITFAEALDTTLIAAAAKKRRRRQHLLHRRHQGEGPRVRLGLRALRQGGRQGAADVDEFLFEDEQPDGSTKHISAYRIRFASGHVIVALSSNPANIRGLQGRVIIDEAAFHRNVAAVIDACNALLIWGGTIRIISTHNGALNAFNELIKETRAGQYDYKIHRVTFDDAVTNGLYERVCLMRGWTPTADGKAEWYRKIRRSYGSRVEAMREELDAIAREGDGVLLPLAWIEACSTPDYKVVRWEPPKRERGCPTSFTGPSGSAARRCSPGSRPSEAGPCAFAEKRLTWFLGEDFAMRQDRSCLPIGFVDQQLKRHVPLIVELRQCPYDQQKQALFWMVDLVSMIGRFGGGVLDANGNGMALAQEAAQKYGPDRIVELMPSDAWRRETGPRFRAAFQDGTILIPADIDVRNDLRQLQEVGGVAKMPKHIRTEGTDGGKRHGDAAVALWNFHAATMNAAIPAYGYEPVGRGRGSAVRRDDDDETTTSAGPGGGRRSERGWPREGRFERRPSMSAVIGPRPCRGPS